MKQRVLSAALALCLCISSTAYATEQEDNSTQENVSTEESGDSTTSDSMLPTPTEIYNAMIALKDQDGYMEGTVWTDYEPYSDSKGYYHWKGGTLSGTNIVAVGCVAFAFILSDAAFGSLPNRIYAMGQFKYEDIKVGDILRVNNDTHTVIVLEVSDVGVVVAEGNNHGKVHWGRTISKEEVMDNTSYYITRYPEGYIAPDDPEADTIIAEGTLETGLTWNLTKVGNLVISGNGAMPDFSSLDEQPWKEYRTKIRKVVIKDGVTSIGNCAFWSCGVLSVEIPSSVTTIGNYAFYKSSIIYVFIPSSVTTIGSNAFYECENLSSVTVSEGVETIGQKAFYYCPSLGSIDLPASIEEVGSAAFFQCTGLLHATFAAGSNQVKLGNNLFTDCYALMDVTLPQSINCIGDGMFQNCHMLAGVIIPEDAASIGGSAFASSGVSVVVIPDSVTTIGIAAFSACPLEKIYFTGNETQWSKITKIGDTASAVSKTTIYYNYVPDSNKDNNNNNSDNPSTGNNSDIGDNSSTGDNSDIGDNSESDNSQAPEQTPFAKGNTFTISKITYKVTKAGAEVKLIASKSISTNLTINTVTGTDGVKYNVTSIGSKAMQNNKKITSLTIGANVKTIGANAFSGCTKLTTVNCGKTANSSLTTIGKSTFNGCKKLNKVIIKSTKLSSVGKQAFKGTKSALKVKVPSKQLTKYKKLLKKAGLKDKQVTK